MHGELLIEMEDNVYCKDNDRLFSIIVFFILLESIKLYGLSYKKNDNFRHKDLATSQVFLM
jgi:hypothetical protein